MKIKHLTIKNYKQFKNLELDLTYPKGHEKAGEPLDKICIIGQSGAGKTNLLEIIKKSVIDFSKLQSNSYLPFDGFYDDDNLEAYIANKFVSDNKLSCETLFAKYISQINKNADIEPQKNEKIYFVGANKALVSVNNRNIDEEISKIKQKRISITYSIERLKSDNLIDRAIIDITDKNSNSWGLLKGKIDDYKNRRSEYLNRLTAKLVNDDNYGKEEYKNDLIKWEADNENILDNISAKLNSILRKFNLELAKIDENQQSYDELIIKDLSNDRIIKYDNLSTGTKNLLSTFIPLKIHSPQDSIVLIDEPEISFYPDIQRELTGLYMSVGENNQLILATHSPLIASSFEPWEVVELKFDENNQVYRERYYDGENSVENYFVDPRALTWTGILTDVFDLEEDSNFTFREKKLMEYATLKAFIKTMGDAEAKEEKFKELQKISKILGLAN